MTIYDALVIKLGRTPTNEEIKADVRRIMDGGLVLAAEHGRLPHQRKSRKPRR